MLASVSDGWLAMSVEQVVKLGPEGSREWNVHRGIFRRCIRCAAARLD